MSYYYDYYVGYKLDDKIYPLGPFDNKGKLKPVISDSSSFASTLYQRFYEIRESEVSDEFRANFEWEDWQGKKTLGTVKYLPVDELPTGSFVKSGYFLIDDVKAYEANEEWFEGFYDTVSPVVYVAMAEKELKFGKNQPKKDGEGFEYTEPNASDYMFYVYPDYKCEEFDAFMLRRAASALEPYDAPEGMELVIIESEG